MKHTLRIASILLTIIAMTISGCHKDPGNGGGDDPTTTTYTVTFDANGGVGTMQPQIFNNGESRPLNPNAFTRDGYFFAGWNTKYDGSGTSYNDKETITVSQDMVLYAQWSDKEYKVTFDANGGVGEMQPQTFYVDVAQTLSPNAFTRENHIFTSWNTAADGSGTTFIDCQETTISEDITLYAQWRMVPTGALGGLFSVSSTKKVYFSKGNLQYCASTNTWRFAENQVDCIGSDNGNIAPSYSGWIDLFGWGSGDNPTNTSTSSSDYDSFNDWGNNPISNGGNTANQWQTMTKNEWNFLVFNRPGVRFAKAKVNGVAGLILLPDDWNTSYYPLKSTNSNNSAYSVNIINSDDWTNLFETKGAVFLPAAGSRSGTYVFEVGESGCYWSSTLLSSGASGLLFTKTSTSIYTESRYYGHPVRLVTVSE